MVREWGHLGLRFRGAGALSVCQAQGNMGVGC